MPVTDDLQRAAWTAVETLEDAATSLTNQHLGKIAGRCELDAQALADALRAALAAQPQPLFEGTVDDAWVQDRGTVVVVAGVAPVPEQLDGQRVVVYPAVARSATPHPGGGR
jgi:hypothetical protein